MKFLFNKLFGMFLFGCVLVFSGAIVCDLCATMKVTSSIMMAFGCFMIFIAFVFGCPEEQESKT